MTVGAPTSTDGGSRLRGLTKTRYSLDEVNRGYDDLLSGKNIRGLIMHEG